MRDAGHRTTDGAKSKNNISTPQGGGHNKSERNCALQLEHKQQSKLVKIFDIFDSPEHNFDSWPTKIIGWPDLCQSKPHAKFKINPKRNVACRLNTRKYLWTQVRMWTMTVRDP